MQLCEILYWGASKLYALNLKDNILILLLTQYIGVSCCLVLLFTICLGCSLFLQSHLCILCSSISLLLILDLFLVSFESMGQTSRLAFFNRKNSSLSNSSNSELMSVSNQHVSFNTGVIVLHLMVFSVLGIMTCSLL
jgi:hypothetical protein